MQHVIEHLRDLGTDRQQHRADVRAEVGHIGAEDRQLTGRAFCLAFKLALHLRGLLHDQVVTRLYAMSLGDFATAICNGEIERLLLHVSGLQDDTETLE